MRFGYQLMTIHKGIQGNLNDLELPKKQSIEKKASVCEEATRRAIEY